MKRAAFATGLVAFAAAFTMGACDDDFIKGWFVDRTRVLGARVEATAEPSRASIAPAEHARVTWLVGAPHTRGGTPPLHWSYALCASPEGNFPEPRCLTPVYAAAKGTGEGALVPIELDAPPAEVIGPTTREMLMLIAFCEDDVTTLDARQFTATCAKGNPVLASLTIRLASAGPNRNPEIVNDAVLFDGSAILPPGGAPSIPCAGTTAAIAAQAGTKHAFAFRFRAEDREVIPPTPLGATAETLLVSHLANAGELERQYSLLEPDEQPREVTIEWTAPNPPEPGESTAEIFVILRDGRGGAALARYVACVRK